MVAGFGSARRFATTVGGRCSHGCRRGGGARAGHRRRRVERVPAPGDRVLATTDDRSDGRGRAPVRCFCERAAATAVGALQMTMASSCAFACRAAADSTTDDRSPSETGPAGTLVILPTRPHSALVAQPERALAGWPLSPLAEPSAAVGRGACPAGRLAARGVDWASAAAGRFAVVGAGGRIGEGCAFGSGVVR